jgi:DNA polymerase-3 subunit alpha
VDVHESYVEALMDVKRQEAIGQDSLFAAFGDGPSIEAAALPPVLDHEWDKKEKLVFEREMLGLYVSDHPLFGLEHVLNREADCAIAALTSDEGKPDGATVTIAGMISALQRKLTKNGNPWAIATVEDLDGAIEVLFFPQTYLKVSHVLAEDLVVVVKGRVNRRDDVPTIYALELTLPNTSDDERGPVVLTLATERCTSPVVERLKDVLTTHPGATEVHLCLTRSGRVKVLRLDDAFRVTPSPALYGDLKALLGPTCLA